jgi:hypothetical protein
MFDSRKVFAVGMLVTVAALFVTRFESPRLIGAAVEQLNARDARTASFTIDCTAQLKPISPLIYGIGGSDSPGTTGTTALRLGGNPTSRYNWELDTYNVGSDWFFKNAGGSSPGTGYERFLTENMDRGIASVLTIPMLGWVAKDSTSYAFPVSGFGRQKATAPEQPDAGNGVGPDGKPIPPGPPTITSVPWPPEKIERLVRQIREKDRTGGRSVQAYILDNEPMLWNATHRDVHPDPTTYDELLDKTIAYGSAVRRADPGAQIAGPAEWGWLAYQYSAKDTAAGVFLRPDRRQHGDVPLLPWYLRKLREHEQRTGVRILDIVDVHFYPMGDGIKVGNVGGGTDPATAARRIRATRSLWDPTYLDESWINERMQVLPLLQQWIAENYPGRGISIGEWDFGAEKDMSGALATAEVLGRFGLHGVTSAYHWGRPAEDSPAYWAFKAYRNFDRRGGHFQDWSVPVRGEGTLVSLFASSDKGHSIVAIVLNLAPLSPIVSHISLQGCGTVASARGFRYVGGAELGFTKMQLGFTKDTLDVTAAPYSINVLDLGTQSPEG